MRLVFRLIGTACCCITAAPAWAQTPTPTPGTVRGLFGAGVPANPGRTTQQLSLWFDLGGGYDRFLEVSGVEAGQTQEGRATSAVGAFRYWRGRTTRFLEATGRLFRNAQGVDQPETSGGEANVTGRLDMGPRATLNFSLRASNDAAILFGAFGPEFGGTEPADRELNPPEVSVQPGQFEFRWFSYGGSVDAYRDWSPRQRTTATYSQLHRSPTEGNGLDSDERYATLRHDWNLRPNSGFLATYRFERVQQNVNEFDPVSSADPVRTQTIEGGVRYEFRVSPIRTVTMSATAGAANILSVQSPLAQIPGSVEPTGSAAVSYTLARRWLISANASRTITVLQGITWQPFKSDIATVTLTGVMARRLTVAVAGSVSRGNGLDASPGAFDAAGGTASIRYGFRYGGVFAGYTRYRHNIREAFTVPGSVAPRFDQHSVRTGVTLWLPLYGWF